MLPPSTTSERSSSSGAVEAAFNAWVLTASRSYPNPTTEQESASKRIVWWLVSGRADFSMLVLVMYRIRPLSSKSTPTTRLWP